MRILVLLSAVCAPANVAYGADKEATVYVTMISHFDRPWAMTAADIAAFEQLSKNHPQLRWTHLYNPVAYTQDTALRDEMERYIKRSRDEHQAEIGVHLHMYESVLKAGGVEFVTHPSLSAETVAGSHDETGYAVPLTRYSRAEISRLLDFTRQTFRRQGLGRPQTFCAGFYATNLDLQKEIASQGYTTSAAAFPPGTTIGLQYAPTWHQLSGWQASVTFKTPPYRVSQQSILPTGKAPFIMAEDGQPLVEIPQTCKIDWMVTAEDMKVIFKEHLAIARRGQPSAVCLAIHETSGAGHFAKYDEVLSYIDEHITSQSKPTVQYVTASELRAEFLGHWSKREGDDPPYLRHE